VEQATEMTANVRVEMRVAVESVKEEAVVGLRAVAATGVVLGAAITKESGEVIVGAADAVGGAL
jgi:outer membrane lipoprotein SlyB